MSQKELADYWYKLSLYLILIAGASWATTQGISPDFGVELDKRRQVTALLAIVIVCPLYLMSLWFACRYSDKYGGTKWASKVPYPIAKEDENFEEAELLMHQHLRLLLFIFFPILAITHFYGIFLQTPVISKINGETVNMWQFFSPVILFTDDFRYGENKGVTFFPLYQPLFITALFSGCWIFLIIYLRKIFQAT